MKDVIRIVLVDPIEESRTALQRLLGGITSLWLSEVLTSYQEAANRAEEIAAHLTIVVLDHDPNQAVDLIQKLTQANAARDRAAREPQHRQRLDPEGHPRRSARVSHAAGRSRPSCSISITRLARGRNESQTTSAQGPRIITVTGAAGGVGCTTAGRQPGDHPGRHQGAGNHLARSRPPVRIGRRLSGHRHGPYALPRASRTLNGST